MGRQPAMSPVTRRRCPPVAGNRGIRKSGSHAAASIITGENHAPENRAERNLPAALQPERELESRLWESVDTHFSRAVEEGAGRKESRESA